MLVNISTQAHEPSALGRLSFEKWGPGLSPGGTLWWFLSRGRSRKRMRDKWTGGARRRIYFLEW